MTALRPLFRRPAAIDHRAVFRRFADGLGRALARRRRDPRVRMVRG